MARRKSGGFALAFGTPLILLLALQPGPTLGAQAEPLTLGQALERALSSSPILAAAGADRAAWSGRLHQAGRWTNPAVELDLEEYGLSQSWDPTDAEFTVGVRQAIALSARRARSLAAAAAGLEAARLTGEWRRHQVVARVRTRFVAAQAAQQRLLLAREALALARRGALAVGQRIAGGDLPAGEQARVDVEVMRRELEVEAATAELHSALVAIAATWGGSPEEVVAVAGELPAPSPLPDGQIPVDETPALAPLQARQQRADAEAGRVAAEAVPDLEVGLGYRGTRGFTEHSLVLAVGLPVPLFDNRRGAVDAARAVARRQRYEARQARADWQLETARLAVRVSALDKRHRALTERLLPSLAASHQLVEEGFAAGRYSTLDLLASQQRLVAERRAALATLEAFWRSRIELDMLLGTALPETKQETP